MERRLLGSWCNDVFNTEEMPCQGSFTSEGSSSGMDSPKLCHRLQNEFSISFQHRSHLGWEAWEQPFWLACFLPCEEIGVSHDWTRVSAGNVQVSTHQHGWWPAAVYSIPQEDTEGLVEGRSKGLHMPFFISPCFLTPPLTRLLWCQPEKSSPGYCSTLGRESGRVEAYS